MKIMFPAHLLEHRAKVEAWQGTPAGDGTFTHGLVTVAASLRCRLEELGPHLLRVPVIGSLERARWFMTWTDAGPAAGHMVTPAAPFAGCYVLEEVRQDPAGAFWIGVLVESAPLPAAGSGSGS